MSAAPPVQYHALGRSSPGELAAQARSGEVVGFHGVTLLSNGKYVVHDAGGLTRLEAAGALLDAAIARLGYQIRDDA